MFINLLYHVVIVYDLHFVLKYLTKGYLFMTSIFLQSSIVQFQFSLLFFFRNFFVHCWSCILEVI